MTTNEISEILNREFYENFSTTVGDMILNTNSGSNLILLLRELIANSSKKHNKCEFRAAYVAEHLYFRDKRFKEELCLYLTSIFPKIKNESTKRHIGKIMAHSLKNSDISPNSTECEQIASACIEWCIKPKVRVAVIIWAMECLIQLRDRVEWLPDIMDDILDTLSIDPTPGMSVRLRRWKMII